MSRYILFLVESSHEQSSSRCPEPVISGHSVFPAGIRKSAGFSGARLLRRIAAID
jgi:hypothetical protein